MSGLKWNCPFLVIAGAVVAIVIPARPSTYAFVVACVFSVGVATTTVPPKEPPLVTDNPCLTLNSLVVVAIHVLFSF